MVEQFEKDSTSVGKFLGIPIKVEYTSFKEEAEKHWQYTKEVILASSAGNLENLEEDDIIELCHKLYTLAMVHGYKHGIQDKLSSSP
jgi:hypothetical protein